MLANYFVVSTMLQNMIRKWVKEIVRKMVLDTQNAQFLVNRSINQIQCNCMENNEQYIYYIHISKCFLNESLINQYI